MSQKEYCGSCRIALREWEWSGRGFCEYCEETMDEANRDERTKFEAWATQEAMVPGCMWWDTKILFERKASGQYVNRVLESSWRAWLASKVES